MLCEPEKRWTPARRIFNQDAYSASKVTVDGTIPVRAIGSWLLMNTFRSRAYVDRDGSVCVPPGKRAEP